VPPSDHNGSLTSQFFLPKGALPRLKIENFVTFLVKILKELVKLFPNFAANQNMTILRNGLFFAELMWRIQQG